MTAEKMEEEEKLMNKAKDNFSVVNQFLERTYSSATHLGEQCGVLAEANKGIVDHISNLSAMTEEVSSQSERTVDIHQRSYDTCQDIVKEMDQLMVASKNITE